MPLPVSAINSASAQAIYFAQGQAVGAPPSSDYALSEDDITHETYIKEIKTFHNSPLDVPIPLRIHKEKKLYWIESSEVPSLPARVEFINKVAEKMTQAAPDRFKPLIIISMGSGGLLTDEYIYRQLVKAGYADIRYRGIDVGYEEEGENFFIPDLQNVYRYTKDIRASFIEDKPAAQCFNSEQAYFREKMKDGTFLAEGDRAQGNVVLLSVYPPVRIKDNPVNPIGLTLQAPQPLLLKGRIVAPEDANCIYVVGCKETEKDTELNRIKYNLTSEAFIFLSTAVRITINDNGTLDMDYARDNRVNKRFGKLLQTALSKKKFDANKIGDLYKIVAEETNKINTVSQNRNGTKYYYEAYFANEFTKGLERIESFCAPVFFATLAKGKTFIKP